MAPKIKPDKIEDSQKKFQSKSEISLKKLMKSLTIKPILKKKPKKRKTEKEN